MAQKGEYLVTVLSKNMETKMNLPCFCCKIRSRPLIFNRSVRSKKMGLAGLKMALLFFPVWSNSEKYALHDFG
jgi:hypothetical protein